ncbi:ABC transporter permease [Mesorhizobium argentiipisi]|uniref:ABC transporter permease n=1 Tax=Mesorhizobium argentiipisi TaxID=3015175 RepID=A0ABU8KCK9_9HYPH
MILRLAVWLILGFLLAPIAIIILFSFHASPALSFPFQGFSLRWYVDLFHNGQLGDALIRSLVIATATALLCLILGATAALAWLRVGPRTRLALELLWLSPIALPGLFIGVSLVVLFAQVGIRLSVLTIIIGHVVIALPVLILTVRARLMLFDPQLEEAARDLGAGQFAVFRRVTLPLLMPTLIAASLLAFAVSFDEFIVTVFVAGTETTLPMYVWSMMRRTVTPLINAVSTLALFFSIVLLCIAWTIGHIRRRTTMAARAST